MKIGIMSAAFPAWSFEQVLELLSANGFGSVEACCWPARSGKDRKYGGVVHVDVESLSRGRADELVGMCRDRGVELSAHELGVPVVGTFVGRPAGRPQTRRRGY